MLRDRPPSILHRSYSDDEGRTWTDPESSGLYGHCPSFLALPSGTLLLGHRQVDPARCPGCSLSASTDLGATWHLVHDCKAAVRWLRAHSDDYGLDPDRIGSAGSSAGGHLSALLGASAGVAALEGQGGNTERSSSVQATLAVCGPTDLTRIGIPEHRERFEVLYEVTENFLGGPVEQRGELARLVSPLTYASATCPPMLIVHGEDDPTVPVAESIIFHEALQKAGADSTLMVLEGVGHACPWDQMEEAVVSFFRRTLG